jgi:hypothetical protein
VLAWQPWFAIFTQKEEVKLPQAPPLLFFLCLFDFKSSYALTGTNSTSTAGPASVDCQAKLTHWGCKKVLDVCTVETVEAPAAYQEPDPGQYQL